MLEDQVLSASYLTSSAFFDTFNQYDRSRHSKPGSRRYPGTRYSARLAPKMALIVGTSSIDRRLR